MTRTVVVGGAGQVGELFTRLCLKGGRVVSIDGGDTLVPGAESVTGDACTPTDAMLDEISEADVVIFALPERAALAAARACAPAVRPGTLLVETLSVQQVVTRGLTVLAEERGAEVCGLNPMFAPALGFDGNAVAAIRVVDGPRTATMIDLIEDSGADVVTMSAEEHDRITAVLQAATHAAVLAFGSVVAEQGDIKALIALAPPPHLTLLALLARITGGNLDVYWDIQAANPSAADARAALSEAVTVLDKLATVGDRDGFWEWVRRIDDHLGDHGPGLRDRCAELFALPSR
ncbi:prephenate dehydrogenase/arogenate dehydrogenase family protein [Lentzea tibetensis]|uniref:Prephenate dehydrogenase/arogenate dehydrogenase family protein n=1 Tax=Lentzea tibetensis TaxID=2591470 RepID=A0A563EQ15_9PSEU|nr:prephenate dehydrogenase dimerization domain-containing protein [Lentzea tibetensis]TWP48851.1 prephenate dehydrogenase/arogenate dehydrogenase family protein [Lentzea tibetensis]